MRCVKGKIFPAFFTAVLMFNLVLSDSPATEYVPVETPKFKYLGKPKKKSAVVTDRVAQVKKSASASKKKQGGSDGALDKPNVETPPPASSPAKDAGESAAQTFPLFGTVGFKRPLEKAPAWADAINRNNANSIFQPDRYFNKKTSWKMFKEEAEKLDDRGKLNKVNAFFNSFPYITDQKNWGKEDYWAIPSQFLKKSGDCEDYAIIKYFTLRELGFPAESMRIVIVLDTLLNEGHAVLAVKTGGTIYILDNQSRIVLPQERIHNYEAQYSVNELGRWNQMKPINRKK